MFFRILITALLSTFLSTTLFADPAMNNANKNDRDILGWLIVLNQNEIAAAKVVQQKKALPAVKDYAKWMNKEHSRLLQETQKLSKNLQETPLNTQMTTSLKDEGKQELKALKPLKEKELDTNYINAMVKGHEKALEMINQNLLEQAQNDKVKQLLITTRTHVEHHLEKAQAIQQQLATN